jgi:hypothetical protein
MNSFSGISTDSLVACPLSMGAGKDRRHQALDNFEAMAPADGDEAGVERLDFDTQFSRCAVDDRNAQAHALEGAEPGLFP